MCIRDRNKDNEVFAYYELIPYNYSFLSAEQKFIVHDSFRQLIAQSREGKIHALQIATESSIRSMQEQSKKLVTGKLREVAVQKIDEQTEALVSMIGDNQVDYRFFLGFMLDIIEENYRRITAEYGRESVVGFAGTGREGGTLGIWRSLTFRTCNWCYSQSGYACYVPRMAAAAYNIGSPYPEIDYAGGLAGRYDDPAFELPECVVIWGKMPLVVKLRQCLDHIDELNKHISEVEQEILRLSDKYEAALNLIRTVPGFNKNPLTAIQVLSEIGGDMSVFPTAKHLVSWAGCCPRNDQSNQKIKSTRISRAGSYFKPVLVQVANALIKSKKHSEFTSRYKRIKARRGHKKAIIAICRMILTAIWHIPVSYTHLDVYKRQA